jgi:hypothetical protein
MPNQKLVNYVKYEMSKGISLQDIKRTLLSQGLSEHEIDEAISLAMQQIIFSTSKPTIKLSIILALGFAIIIGGAFAFFMFGKTTIAPGTTTITLGLYDCGTDLECFITASQNCKPSKVTHNVTIDVFGVKQITSYYYELKGLEANKCKVYFRIEKIDLAFPPGTSQEVIDQQKEIYRKLEKRDGTCKFNTNELAAMLRKWKEGRVEGSASCTLVGDNWECTYTGDWKVAEDCQGTFFSQV